MRMSDAARAIVKFCIFAFLAFELVMPVAQLLLSIANDDTDPGFVNYAAAFMGMLLRFTMIYFGMSASCAVSRKLRRNRILQIGIGFAFMGAVLWFTQYVSIKLTFWIAMITGGVLAASWVIMIGLIALTVFLWKIAGPWAFIAYSMFKDDREN